MTPDLLSTPDRMTGRQRVQRRRSCQLDYTVVVLVCNEYRPLGADGDSLRRIETASDGNLGSAKSIYCDRRRVVEPARHRGLPTRAGVDLYDLAVARLRDVYIPPLVDSDALRESQPRTDRELSTSVGGDLDHPVVAGVRNEDVPRGIERYTIRMVQTRPDRRLSRIGLRGTCASCMGAHH
jgi:hypothetical protein